ncbi:MAG: phosphohistidine phosphatase [Solirubrobacteraceae bacterium]|jgi:phosphohistidine phosphatase|nr:phosphohistidine phosphatase [Solirubrobacteraceae bacterium]
MARELWLLRHGEAEPHDARPDEERRLTPRGERQSRDAGAALAKLGVELAAAYTSPRVRALDTARLACESLGADPEVVDALTGGWDADGARELLAGHEDGDAILVVGHEPDLSQVVHDLTGGRVNLKKGGIATVRVDGARAELFVLLRPKETEAIAAA